MRTIAIVQARMGSTRFPNKVMRRVCGETLIGLLLGRLSRSERIDRIILATSANARDHVLADHARSLGFEVYQGDESDVLNRFYEAARTADAERVVRVTGDCPLIDPALVDALIARMDATGADYLSNTDPPTYPDGLDVEVFTFAALERAWRDTFEPYDREHVTPYIRAAADIPKASLTHSIDLSAERWTVDEPDDLVVVGKVFEHFHPRRDFTWVEVLELKRQHPEYFEANRHLTRNEGASVSQGQKLWKRAKRVIPGGSMLLSKRAEMFLPDQWPAYFSRARGCDVWDLDGRHYVDMSIMGIGTNILGYGHPEVDQAVMRVVADGNMSTLNCPEEVLLAERLVEIHPWADMVRFARTGGEADAIAVRVARAASGRDKVAFCGYHGWHDWYLAANIADEENLTGHLLPGLDPAGVPRSLRGTILPFHYNCFDELEAIVENHPGIGVIMMEVSRSEEPRDGFLEKIRKLATDHGIVLIFDECTSGFRETFGGLHKKYTVEPDMAMFGKALGNGYAITATIGRREVMEAAQSTFISSTFWTERIGPVAALATLEVMEQIESWKTISRIGNEIKDRWGELASRHGLDIDVGGLAPLPEFSFPTPDALAHKTLITQEMLKKGYLAGTSVYVCIEHDSETIDRYFEALDPVFAMIRECRDGRDVEALLDGPVCHDRFRRIN